MGAILDHNPFAVENTPPSSKIRILNVEDSVKDSELISLQLEHDGIPCELVRVDTEQDLVQALRILVFDLVIADFTVPSLSGSRSLEIVRALCPDTPFIFFSGTLGEEAAIESLRNGATDYVLKQRSARLVPAVRRALKEAAAQRQKKQMEEALRQTGTELSLKNRIADIFLTVPSSSMFGDVLRTVLEITASEDGVFGYVDGDGSLVCSAIVAAAAEPRVVARFPRGEWTVLWGQLVDRQPVCTNHSFLPVGHVPVRRLLVCPILYENEIIGHFGVANKPTDYTESDVQLLQHLATYVAPVLKVRLQRDAHEQELCRALASKEILLREVHHRVKNNLQIVSSLLNLQAKSLPQSARDILHDTQSRVRAMALVHEQLYQHGNTGDLNFAIYARKLANELGDACTDSSTNVQLRFDLEPVQLDANRSVPCGLILNELLTNALKHAFPNNRSGEILVALRCDQKNQVELRVADDGVGLPPGLNWERTSSLGLQMVSVLARQMGASLKCETQHGVKFILTFEREESKAAGAVSNYAA